MKGAKISYSADELEWIKANRYRVRPEAHAEFCVRFDRDDVSLSNYAALCKRKGWLTGRTGRFEPGQLAHNKGKKMPFNANSARTQFKKGDRPHTWRGAGHERICSKDGYVWMIVDETNPYTGAETRSVLKHRYLWEQVNGPLPDGMCLKCLDGDKTNTDPSNWECIPRALLPGLTGRWNGVRYATAEPEVKPTILATARLKHRLREVQK